MYRGTTPTITFKISSDLNFNYIKEVWFTLVSGSKKITKTKSECSLDEDAKTISITLTQEETLKFSTGSVNVQMRILTKEGKAFATPIKTLSINNILKEGVIKND
jgi:hypothetical protein